MSKIRGELDTPISTPADLELLPSQKDAYANVDWAFVKKCAFRAGDFSNLFMYEHVLERIRSGPGTSLLQIGGGVSRLGQAFAALGGYAVDYEPDPMASGHLSDHADEAQKSIKRVGGRWKLIQGYAGDARWNGEVDDASFDAAVVLGVLENDKGHRTNTLHMRDANPLFKFLVSKLKPTGSAVYYDPPADMEDGPYGFPAFLGEHGWEITKRERNFGMPHLFHPPQYLEIRQKKPQMLSLQG